MLEINLNGKIVNVPTAWNEVSLGDYEKWYLQKPDTKLEYVQHIADICKTDAKLLLEMPVPVYAKIADTISFTFNQDFEPKSKIVIRKKVGEEIRMDEYFINFSNKLTLGEWVDIDSVLSDNENNNKLSEILAILCRPIGEEYKDDPELIDERKTLFKEQTCDKVLPLIGFFLLKEKRSKEILDRYSTIMAQADQFLRHTKNFASIGGGIKRLPIWQRIRYKRLTKSLEDQLKKCSDSFYTEQINR